MARLSDAVNRYMVEHGMPPGFSGDRYDAFWLGVDLTMRAIRKLETEAVSGDRSGGAEGNSDNSEATQGRAAGDAGRKQL